MLSVHLPSRGRMHALQREQQAYYWSALTESLLRKHGVIGFGASGGFSVVTRNVEVVSEVAAAPGFFEGPLDQVTSAALGLDVRARTVHQLHLSDGDGSWIGTLRYPAFQVREIPARRGVESAPYEFSSDDVLRRNVDIRVQELVPGSSWEAVLFATTDDSDSAFPVAVTDGRRLVTGVPILDLLGHEHSFPPLRHGYFAMLSAGATGRLEDWLVGQVIDHALDAGETVVRVAPWPPGHSAALSIRHDYDRPIDRETWSDLLDFYDRRGIKSSWGFLVRTADRELAGDLEGRGHEVALHTEAPTESLFGREMTELEELTGIRSAGYTAHGGIGAPGYLGEVQHEWAERAGMAYGEMLGRTSRYAHAAGVVRDGAPAAARLVLPPTHNSFDVTTKPEGHALDDLVSRLPGELDSGRHVVVMNHPDIHVDELKSLIDKLDLAHVWKATLRTTALWTDAAKLRSFCTRDGESIAVRFGAKLPAAVEVLVHRSKAARQSFVVPEGAEAAEFPSSGDAGGAE